MIIWDDVKTTTRKFCQDSSTDGKAFQELMLNAGYKELLIALERQITELQADLGLNAGQNEYMMPPDCLTPKTIVLVQDQNRYPLYDEASDLQWEFRTSRQRNGRPEAFHYRPRLGLSGGIIQLDPIPTDGYSLDMTYEATERDLSQDLYNAGSVGLVQGFPTVVGSGTTFTADMVGRYLMPTESGAQRLPYRIKSFTDATHLTLENDYHGPTDSSTTYKIFEMFATPEDTHLLPAFYAAWQWWATKGNVLRANQFKKQWTDGLDAARDRHALTTRNQIITSPDYSFGALLGTDETPSWFPEAIS